MTNKLTKDQLYTLLNDADKSFQSKMSELYENDSVLDKAMLEDVKPSEVDNVAMQLGVTFMQANTNPLVAYEAMRKTLVLLSDTIHTSLTSTEEEMNQRVEEAKAQIEELLKQAQGASGKDKFTVIEGGKAPDNPEYTREDYEKELLEAKTEEEATAVYEKGLKYGYVGVQ